MVIIPAIDLKDGRCVRLRQGRLQDETVYSDDPSAMAQEWESQGARILHIVDLNGAVDGKPENLPQIEAILQAVRIPVQLGGGIRSMETIRHYLGLGVSRVVLGTAALRNKPLVAEACREFPDQIVLGVDAKDGNVAVQGWTAVSNTTARDLFHALAGYPLAAVIYTDIARDGMLEGPNIEALRDLLDDAPAPLIASGGVTQLTDIQNIQALGPKVSGTIIGKALYDGKIDFAQALKTVVSSSGSTC